MKYITRQIVINGDIDDVLCSIYDNTETYLGPLYEVVSSKIGDWKIKKNIKEKTEEYYLYIETLPDALTKYTLEGDKYVKFSVKNKLKKELGKLKVIKTRYRLLNVNPFIKTIINGLELLKVKMTTEIRQATCDSVYVTFKIFVNFYLPNSNILETFVMKMCDNIVDNLILRLQNIYKD